MAILDFTEKTVVLNLDRHHKASYDKADSGERDCFDGMSMNNKTIENR